MLMLQQIVPKIRFVFVGLNSTSTTATVNLRNYSSRRRKMPVTTTSSAGPSSVSQGPKQLVISVDGNISAGKSTVVSTLVELFPKDFNYAVESIPEPLGKWMDMKGHNLLDLLYKDTSKNNFMFQHYVQLTRLIDTVNISKTKIENGEQDYQGKITIMERSLQNNRYCFSELARREGTLQEAEFSVLAEWFKWVDDHIELPLDLIIYLRTSPQVVFDRMKSRGRTEESTVPLAYLSDLHETYEDWLIRNKIEEEGQDKQKYKVIIIDADKSKEEVIQQCHQLIQKFLSERDAQQNVNQTNQQEKLD